jgi:hypothetical protein
VIRAQLRLATVSTLAFLVGATACSRAEKPPKAPSHASALDLFADDAMALNDCSPFASLDGRRLVAFSGATATVA